MARYELILKLDGALWLRIISKPLLTPKTAMEGPQIQKESKIDASYGSGAHPYQNPLYEQKIGPHIILALSRERAYISRTQHHVPRTQSREPRTNYPEPMYHF